MRRGFLIVLAATAGFGLLHSALADPAVKGLAGRLLGPGPAGGLYRGAYNLAAVVALAGLVVVVRRQPGRELYRAGGAWWWGLRGGQLAVAGVAAWGLWHAGVGEFVGWDGLSAWWRGDPAPRVPTGQGPALDPGGVVRATGPFALSRQPLNWVLIPLLWLNPRMTARLLAFNLAATAYLVAGAAHSDAALGRAYGPGYDDYRARVPFLLGPPPPGP